MKHETAGTESNERLNKRLIEEHEAVDDKLLSAEVEEVIDWPTRLTSQPSLIEHGTMRDYQIEALNWMISLHDNGVCGILADEMGLGKTLETISLLAYLKQYRNSNGPHLIIVPKSTLGNWMREINKWCPSLSTIAFHGSKEERALLRTEMTEKSYEVIVTTYEITVIELSFLKKLNFGYIIIDEAHRIKNDTSKLSITVRVLQSSHRLLITGTPLQNNLQELWALLNFLIPSLFDTSDQFSEWFNLSSESDAQHVISQLHRVLRPFILRRLKADVESSLKPKIEMTLYVGLSKMQKDWYRKLLSREIDLIHSATGQRTRLLNMLMHLRKVCNHPYLFEGAEKGPPFVEGDHIIENAGKMVLLDKLLSKLKKQGSRVLIFSQMTRALDILDDYCSYRGYERCRIDGQTSQELRESQMEEYNAPNSSKFIFLLSTRAGGLGINLQTADTVILYDSDWNPQMDLQACDRAHRIGQKKQVRVFRLVCEGTIEEKIVERAYSKLFLDAIVIQQGRAFHKKQSKISSNEMLSMIRFGAEEIFRSEDSSISDEDIDAILAKGEQRTNQLNSNIESRMSSMDLSQLSFDGNYGQASVYEFEGETFSGKKSEFQFVDVGKRRRDQSYSIDDYYKTAIHGRKTKEGSGIPQFRSNAKEYQFFSDPKRMLELEKMAYQCLVWRLKDELGKDAGKKPKDLSDAEMDELETIKSTGLCNWTKKDFYAFIRANERFGKKQIEKISKSIEGKTEDEVKLYYDVFWSRITELQGWQRYVSNIDKNEARRKRLSEYEKLISAKIKACKDPMRDLAFRYNKTTSKYSTIEDRFLFAKMHELGYGSWDEIQAAIRESYVFRFDWFIKTRTTQEIARRCDHLIKLASDEKPTKRKKPSTSLGKKKAKA